jgi:hypothetical protein
MAMGVDKSLTNSPNIVDKAKILFSVFSYS